MGFRIANGEVGQPEWGYKDTTTSVLVRGDHAQVSSGKLVRMDSAADNLAYAGIIADSSPAGENDGVRFYPPKGRNLDIEFEHDLDTLTACVKWDKLQWNADQALKKSDTDSICYCSHANSGATAATVRFKMLDQEALLGGDAA